MGPQRFTTAPRRGNQVCPGHPIAETSDIVVSHRIHCFIIASLLVFTGAASAAQPKLLPCLVATYSDDQHTITTIAPTVGFTLKENESLHPQLAPAFKARWDGFIHITDPGTYSFQATGATISVAQGDTTKPLELAPGHHRIRIDYQRPAGPAQLLLQWRSDSFILEPIPSRLLGHKDPPAQLAQHRLIERGRILIEELNCLACHTHSSASLTTKRAPDLSTIGSRASPQWISKYLEDPRHFRSTATMPIVVAKEQDRRNVAAYLATLKDLRKLPDEDAVTPQRIQRGQELFESIGCLACHGKTGTALDGLASKTNHNALVRYLMDPLKAHPAGRMPGMLLERDQATALSAFLLSATPADGAEYFIRAHLPEYEGDFEGGDVQAGQQIVRVVGCLNCHTIQPTRGRPLEPLIPMQAPSLNKLNPTLGCMAQAPRPPSPNYRLSKDDSAAITAFLTSFAQHPDRSPAPTHALAMNLQRFNCASCHALDDSLPPERFALTPPLTGVGHKLREDWTRAVILERQRVRPWIPYRMPDFGPAAARLPAQLAAASGAAPIDGPAMTRDQVNLGRNLMGTEQSGLGCVACHSYNGSTVTVLEPARGPELTGIAQRVRPDWFTRWLRDPNRIHPGTAMPTFFMGKSDAESRPQIDALWAYASMGRSMLPPPGVDAKPNDVLIPNDRPIVMRCLLHGGGKDNHHPRIVRAIAVGFPSLTHYAFDAKSSRLVYAWTGGFIDMAGGWSQRGDASGKRLGKPFFNAPNCSPIYFDSLDREQRSSFTGYELVKGTPRLLYTIDGVPIIETVTPTDQGAGITRTFELNPAGKTVHLILTDDPSITATVSEGTIIETREHPAGLQGTLRGPLRMLKLPGNEKLSVSVTLTAKESK